MGVVGDYIRGYEDNYGGQEHDSVKSIADHIEAVAFSNIGDLNWPVWAETYPCSELVDCEKDLTEVGWFLPRKGKTYIDFCYQIDEEQTKRIRQLLLRFWAGRADIGFARHNTANWIEQIQPLVSEEEEANVR